MLNSGSEIKSDEEYIVAFTKYVQDTLENKDSMMHYFSKTFTRMEDFSNYYNFIKSMKGSIIGFDLAVGSESLYGNYMIIDISLDIVNDFDVIKHIIYIFILPVKK